MIDFFPGVLFAYSSNPKPKFERANFVSLKMSSDFAPDEYVVEQIGGGHRSISPTVQTPTRLRTKIKATARDGGLVRGAQGRRAKMGGETGAALPEPSASPADSPRNVSRTSRVVPAIQSATCSSSLHSPNPQTLVALPLDSLVPQNAAPYTVPTSTSTASNDPSFIFPCEFSSALPPSTAPSRASSATPLPALPHHEPPPAALSPISPPRASSVGLELHSPASLPTGPLAPSNSRLQVTSHKIAVVPEVGSPQSHSNDQSRTQHDVSSDRSVLRSEISLPSTPMNGRRSNRVHQCLQKGFDEMETILQRVAEDTTMTTQQVAEAWHRDRGRIINSSNYWNMYQAYWKANEAAEQTRAGVGLDEPTTPTLMSRCYKKFMADQGEVWKETLDVFELAEVTKTSEHTLAQRSQSFHNVHRKICHLMDSAAAKYGFQSAFLMCGNIVNEDNMFGRAYTSKGAADFWKVRCKADDDTIIGHLKAHVFHLASLDVVAGSFPDDELDAHSGNGEIYPAPPGNLSQAAPNIEAGPSAQAEILSDNYSECLKTLKMCLTNAVKAAGADESKLSIKNFPWKTLLSIMASAGLVMEGYPFDTLMPGERRNPESRTKGINDLKLSEMKRLICALKAGTLTIKRVKNTRETADLLGGVAPVIIQEPPPPSAQQVRGRRMFTNGKWDLKGPRRRSVDTSATPSKRSGMQEETNSDSEGEFEMSVVPQQKKRRLEAVSPLKSKLASTVTSEEATPEGETSEEEPPKRKAKNGLSRRAGNLEKRVDSAKLMGKGKKSAISAVKQIILSDDSLSGDESSAGVITAAKKELPKARPKPRIIRKKIPSENNDSGLFTSSTAVGAANSTVTAALQQEVTGPPDPGSMPASPSPSRALLPNLGAQKEASPYDSPQAPRISSAAATPVVFTSTAVPPLPATQSTLRAVLAPLAPPIHLTPVTPPALPATPPVLPSTPPVLLVPGRSVPPPFSNWIPAEAAQRPPALPLAPLEPQALQYGNPVPHHHSQYDQPPTHYQITGQVSQYPQVEGTSYPVLRDSYGVTSTSGGLIASNMGWYQTSHDVCVPRVTDAFSGDTVPNPQLDTTSYSYDALPRLPRVPTPPSDS